MAHISVDRLTVRLSGLSEKQGATLGTLIAEGLGGAELASGGVGRTSRPGPTMVDRMTVEVAAGRTDDVQALAARFVEAIVAELAQTL